LICASDLVDQRARRGRRHDLQLVREPRPEPLVDRERRGTIARGRLAADQLAMRQL
jgi:hypothetical protein